MAAVSAGEIEATLVLRDQMTSSLKVATQQLEKMGGTITQVGSQLRSIGTSLSIGVTVPLVAAGTAALKFSADFQTTMTKVGNLTDIGAAHIGEMRNSIMSLAPTVGIGPKALGEGLLVIASTGLKGAKALEVLTQSAKASAVGLGETRDIGRAVTSAITAYAKEGLTAAEASNKLFVAVREGGADADAFAGTLGRVVGVAEQMGVSFDEVLASIATFTRLGVNADMATTGLRATIISLLHPSKQAREEFVHLGTSIEEVRKNIKEKGFAAALQDILTLAGGDVDAIGKIIPEARALASVLGTAGVQGAATAEILGKLKTGSTDLDDAFKVASDTLGFKWNQALAKAETVAIKFGDAIGPSFTKALEAADPLLDMVAGLAKAFGELPQPVKMAAIALASLAAIAGPSLFFIGNMAVGIGQITTLAGKLAEAGVLAKVSTGLLEIGTAARASTIFVAGLQAGLIGLGIGIAVAVIVHQFEQLQKDLAATATTAKNSHEVIKGAVDGTGKALLSAANAGEIAARGQDVFNGLVIDAIPSLAALGKEMGDLGPKTKTLGEQLAEAQVGLKALTKEDRANIDAGLLMGKSVKEISDEMKKAEPVVQLYKDSMDTLKKVTKDAKEGAENVRDEVYKLNDAMMKLSEQKDAEIFAEQIQEIKDQINGINGPVSDFQQRVEETADALKDIQDVHLNIEAKFPDPKTMNALTIFTGDLMDDLRAIPALVANAFTGGGGLAGALKGIGSTLGATVGKNLGMMISSATTGLGSLAGPIGAAIGSLAGPAIEALMKIFDHSGKDFRKMGHDLGVNLSQGLVDQLKADKNKFGGEVQALMMNLSKVIDEGGGVAKFGLDKAIAKTRDFFSLIETGRLTAGQVGGEFEKVFSQILPVAIDKSTGLAKKSFLELIDLAKRFGVESASVAAFLAKQGAQVTSGFNAIAKGVLGPVNTADAAFSNSVQEVIKLQDQIDKLYASISDMGASGGPGNAKQTAQLSVWKRELEDAKKKMVELGAAQGTAARNIEDFAKNGQAAFDRVGRLAVAAFGAAVASGSTFLQAIEQIGPGLDQLVLAQDKFGLSSSGSLQQLLGFQQFAAVNKDLLEGLAGVNQMMSGLSNLGLLDQQTFADLSATATDAFAKMVAGGVDSRTALAALQPTLQTIWQIQQDTGLTVDDNTQALIDQAVAAGIVGEKQKTAAQKMVDALDHVADVLDRIADALGVGIPKATQQAQEALDRMHPPNISSPDFGGFGGGFDSSQPGFAGGTHGAFPDFGSGTSVMLHGRERITPLSESESGGVSEERMERLLRALPRMMKVAVEDAVDRR